MAKKKYYIPDLETGYLLEVSKETHKSIIKAWEQARPKTLKGKNIGVPIIFGTGASVENHNEEFLRLFYNKK